ncbi:MAG: VOC family protein [Candidatus Kapaibacterium sp.]
MNKTIIGLLLLQGALAVGFGINNHQKNQKESMKEVDLGIYSLSLSVKDIQASKEFYEALGFEPLSGAGSVESKWMILQKGGVKIGLFQGMFPNNTLTFNPVDARSIYRGVTEAGLDVTYANGVEEESGPCSFMIVDPDGNPILFDQHGE